MNSPRFLCDEDVDARLVRALRQHEPLMDVLCVGEMGAPPRRTTDPDLLIAGKSLARLLLSSDRSTMPAHLVSHFQTGSHTWGVILLRKGYRLTRYMDEIM